MKKAHLLLLLATVCIFLTCKQNEDDMPSGSDGPSLSINPVAKFESDDATTLEFKVRLSAAATEVVRVDYQTSDLAATAGEDYVAQSGALSFDAGTIEQIISIEILGDTIYEGDEDFRVTLSNVVNATLGFETTTGTIRNDDEFVQGAEDGYITPEAYTGRTLVWQDEFEDDAINLDFWTHELGDSGWGNNESQYYTARDENSYIEDGKLVIVAKEEAYEGADYTSARMITKGKKEFLFGRVDIRAKLPYGQGIWPALWMLGGNIESVGWPACGEIDIMEIVGHLPSTTHGTAHYPTNHLGGSYTLDEGIFADEYHVFSVVWEFNSIKWYLDDQLFYGLTPSQTGNSWPFNNDFFFIFNIAVGGNWPGYPDATTVFPQFMHVDYIRVFN